MKTVMCFGTFDNLHAGHLYYLREAKKSGEKLIVVVARDINVLKLKGRFSRQSETIRLEAVKRLKIVGLAILGQKTDRLAIVKKHCPDTICLGYDQAADLARLKKVFIGEIVRLRSYREDIYKSSKLK